MTVIETDKYNLVAKNDGSTVNLVYILYLVGFFTGISALVGVIIAYVNRGDASEVGRNHYNHQIMVFWRGIVLGAVTTVLYIVTTIIGAMTFGLGFLLMILPLGLMLYWVIWTIIAIIKGMKAIGNNQAV